MSLLGAAISVGGSIYSSMRGHKRSKRGANAAMGFSQQMSDTAHQREVEDLRAAGLNPILSATGGNGAQALSGFASSADAGISGMQSSAQSVGRLDRSVARSQIDANSANAEARRMEGQAALINANANASQTAPAAMMNARSNAMLAKVRADFTREEKLKVRAEMKKILTEAGIAYQDYQLNEFLGIQQRALDKGFKHPLSHDTLNAFQSAFNAFDVYTGMRKMQTPEEKVKGVRPHSAFSIEVDPVPHEFKGFKKYGVGAHYL